MGDAGPETDAERLLQVGGKAHAAAILPYLRGAEVAQLRGEEVLGATRGGGEQRKPAGHCVAQPASAVTFTAVTPRPSAGRWRPRQLQTLRTHVRDANASSP